MLKYMKNPEIVEAVQWLKLEDHVNIEALNVSLAKGKEICNACGQALSTHGMRILDVDMYDIVCPGMWIVTREDGRIEYLDDATFQVRYTIVK